MKVGRDIDEFEVGQVVRFSRTFTQRETDLMGELIGDHNPFHSDGAFVRATRFEAPIVHGLLVGGMICHFGGDLFPGPGYLAETMRFSFLRPVYPGQEITATGTVTKVDRERCRVTFHMTCENESGEQVLEGEVVGIPYHVDIDEGASGGSALQQE
ncbi:enoyl-CoA hydratase [Candidatus Bathyarchaeota archaeon]|nr:enoyl-CoA hydratase [Candidatus Bathyarchaeota archaeon]